MKYLVLPFLLAAASVQAADLTVRFDGVSGKQGDLLIAVYNSAESYKSKQAVSRARLPADGSLETVFKGLVPGRYVVAVFHDRNSNGKLDTNSVGQPQEPYGFSRNPSTQYGPPSFDDAAVTLGNDAQTVVVSVD
ncbi:MAG: DUF2141 domain-containing protein [Rhodocyclaceae bacterium]